jgi:dinuclear metal center YbgI/SA1388 family protein
MKDENRKRKFSSSAGARRAVPTKSGEAARTDIVRFLNSLLAVDSIEDVSRNGLQVEGTETVRRVGLAVDACLASYEAAAANNCQMLIVHHGLIWGGLPSLTGDVYRQVRFLFDAGLNLYAAHLPLDRHPSLGNNARLAEVIGLKNLRDFGMYKGIAIGFEGILTQAKTTGELCRALAKATGGTPLSLPFGPKQNRRIAIVSGSASEIIAEAVAKNIDCYITGEPKHAHYHLAREAGLNVIYGGHYHTETLGVQALGRVLETEFGIGSVFLDLPTTV